MYKIKKETARSWNSFGIAGLLQEEGQVYYENLFNSRHIGRVSDLLSARLSTTGMDELRFRGMILITFFDSFRAILGGKNSSQGAGDKSSQPITMECGVDQEKIVIGVQFQSEVISKEKKDEFLVKLNSKEKNGEFEVWVARLSEIADHVLLRVQSGKPGQPQSIEMIAVLGLVGSLNQKEVSEGQASFEWVDLPEILDETPQIKKYTSLGDLDYPQLLKDDKVKSAGRVGTANDIHRVKGGIQKTQSHLTKVKGGISESDQEKFVVEGTPEVDESLRQALLLRQGQSNKEDGSQSDVQVVSGGEAPKILNDKKIKLYQMRLIQMQKKIEGLEKELESRVVRSVEPTSLPQTVTEVRDHGSDQADVDDEEVIVEYVDEEEGTADAAKRALKSFWGGSGGLQKIWPFKKKEHEESEPLPVQEVKDSNDSEAEVSSQKITSDKTESKIKIDDSVKDSAETKNPEVATSVVEAAEPLDTSETVLEKAAQGLAQSIDHGGLDKAISGLKEGIDSLPSEFKGDKGKKWMEGVLAELISEKAKLKDVGKSLGISARQIELEFKNKERLLKEELRQRDELLRQKGVALSRSKDQITQLGLKLEKLKSSAKDAAVAGEFEKKYNYIKRLLDVEKEEKEQMKSKLDKAKKEVVTLKSQVSAEVPEAVTEDQVEQSKKKIDELRKTAEEQKKAAIDFEKKFNLVGTEKKELEVKLDQAKKLAEAKKGELQALQVQLDNLSRENYNLKNKVGQLAQEVKKVKATKGGTSDAA